MIEFDVETTGLQPWSGTQYAFMFQFFDGERHSVYHWSPINDENRGAIQSWLDRGAQEGIRAWNSKFDWAFGDAAGFTMPPEDKWRDGMLSAHALNERRSVALKSVAVELFGPDADDLKTQVHTWLKLERARRKKAAIEAGEELVEPNFADVPSELMERYGLEDVFLTRRVCDQIDPLIARREDLQGIVDFEHKVLGALYHVEKRGIPADETGYRRLEQEVVDNLERLEDEAIQLGQQGLEGREFNPRSSKDIYDSLVAQGADVSLVENKSMDAENLRTVDHPLAEAILEFRTEYKVLSTYVRPIIGRSYVTAMRAWKEPFIAPDGRIHATYRQVGARTGRMSSADPNMQNQPRDDLRLRYNIVAPEGFKLVTVDLSNIEMRLFAAYAGPGKLLDAIQNGEDMHALTAKMLGIRDRKRSGGTIETARQLAKVYNFSRVYGGGLKTVQKQFRCSRDQARLYNKRYDTAFPEVRKLQNLIEYRLEDQGFIRSLWGRNFRSDNPRREGYKFMNYLVQGTAADLLKAALLRCHADGLPIVGCVHDELLALVPDADAAEAQQLMTEHLTADARPGGKLWNEEEQRPIVPLEAEGDIVQRWSDAKPLKDEDGRPYLFTPKWAGGERRYV